LAEILKATSIELPINSSATETISYDSGGSAKIHHIPHQPAVNGPVPTAPLLMSVSVIVVLKLDAVTEDAAMRLVQ